MDTAWLESLLALVEHGSFTRAAEAQHVSQPAFSRRIRSLEQWFGADLVDRTTFPVTLTRVGTDVASFARGSVAGLAELRDDVRGRQLSPRNAVRISVSHTLAMYYFATWWTGVTGGDVTCTLLPSNTLEAFDALLHGGCDLVLAYADPAHPMGVDQGDLEWIAVAEDRIAPYAKTSEGAPAFSLPGTEGAPVPFVTHGPGAFLGRVTENVIGSLPLQLRPVAQSDLTAALAGLVVAGMGVGWLPGLAAAPAEAAGAICRIGDPSWTAALEIRLYRRRRHHLSSQAALVWEGARH